MSDPAPHRPTKRATRIDTEHIALTRGELRLTLGGRTVRILGEAYLPGHGSPNFVAYRSSLGRWEDGTPLSDDERDLVWAKVGELASKRGWTVAIE